MRIRQVSGQGRNRERATENGEEKFTLLLSISRSPCVHEARSLQDRFISFSSRFPYRSSFVRTYLFTRALFAPTSSSSRFLLQLFDENVPLINLSRYVQFCTILSIHRSNVYFLTHDFYPFHLTGRNIGIFD